MCLLRGTDWIFKYTQFKLILVSLLDPRYPWFSSIPKQMPRCYPQSTLHSMFPMQSPKITFKIFAQTQSSQCYQNLVRMLPKTQTIQPESSTSFLCWLISNSPPNVTLPTSFPKTFTLPPAHLYRKDERVLPRNLHRSKLSFSPFNNNKCNALYLQLHSPCFSLSELMFKWLTFKNRASCI